MSAKRRAPGKTPRDIGRRWLPAESVVVQFCRYDRGRAAGRPERRLPTARRCG